MERMTRAVYDEYVRKYGPIWTSQFLAQNGFEVEGMPATQSQELPPVAPQGALPVAAPAMEQVPAAAPAMAGGIPTMGSVLGRLDKSAESMGKFWEDVARDRKAQYEQATAELEKRRFGPSRSEQLFQLAAAIGKPTYDRSFGSIMANVTPTFAEIEKANRIAAEERSAAAQALRDKYLSGVQDMRFKVLQEEQDAARALVPIVTAQMRAEAPAKVRTGFNPITGELTNMETGEPVANAGLRTLTPQQVATLSRDPRNRGMKFRTTDGRVMEIK